MNFYTHTEQNSNVLFSKQFAAGIYEVAKAKTIAGINENERDKSKKKTKKIVCEWKYSTKAYNQ